MRDYLLIPSLLMITFALGLEILVVMGGGDYKQISDGREKALYAKNVIDRFLATCFYFLADHRPLLGLLGLVGLVLSICNK